MSKKLVAWFSVSGVTARVAREIAIVEKADCFEIRPEVPFFDGSFDHPLTQQKAGAFAQPLEMVRWAPSAVNKQPWRVVLDGKSGHFYERKSKGYVDATGWDIQKIDLGIALCHFVCGLEEQGVKWCLVVADPGLAVPVSTEYIATIEME